MCWDILMFFNRYLVYMSNWMFKAFKTSYRIRNASIFMRTYCKWWLWKYLTEKRKRYWRSKKYEEKRNEKKKINCEHTANYAKRWTGRWNTYDGWMDGWKKVNNQQYTQTNMVSNRRKMWKRIQHNAEETTQVST